MYREIPRFLPEEILVYLRKSRSDDPMLTVEEVLAKHESLLREWIEKTFDAPIPEENWFREVVSGETIANRPVFKKILNMIESPKYKAVLVVECVRLGRPDLEEIGKISKLFRYTNTFVLTREECFDLSYESDRERFERELMRGNDYLEYTKKILYRGKCLSVSQGWYISSVPPYGYNRVWATEGKRERPTLEINEAEADVVRKIFDMYLHEGLGVQAIANRIDKLGIKPRNGKRFSRSLVRDILRNEHYTGKVIWKQRPMKKVVENSEIVTKRDFSAERLVFDGKHEAIISEEDFRKAQAITNNAPKIAIDYTLQNPLSTIMYCECGSIMISKGSNYRKHRYICKYHTLCRNASVETTQVIDAVCDAIAQRISNYEVRLSHTQEDDQKKKLLDIKMVEKRLQECEQKEMSLWEKYTEDKMPKHIFDQLLSKNASEQEKALKELNALKDILNTQSNFTDAVTTLSEALEALKNGEASAEKQNALLKACISKITYSREAPVRVIGKDYNGETKNGWTVPDVHLHIDFKI